MAGERQLPVFAPRVSARLAEQHLDKIPVHAAVIFTQAIDESLDIEIHMPPAGHAEDRKPRPDLKLLAERDRPRFRCAVPLPHEKTRHHGSGDGLMEMPAEGHCAGRIRNVTQKY